MKRLLVITALGLSLVGCGKKDPEQSATNDQPLEDGEYVGDGEKAIPNPNPNPNPNPTPGQPSKAANLIAAAASGDVVAVKKFLADGADVNQRDPQQSTALIAASTMGHAEVVRALIAAKADLDAKNREGNTALMSAAFLCRTESVKALLEAGAELNVRNGSGSTALQSMQIPWAVANPLDYDRIQKTRPEIIKLLQDAGDGAAPAENPGAGAGELFTAVAGGDLEAINKQLAAGVDVNAKEPAAGSTPLMLAAMSGQVAAAKLLIEKGADVKAKNTDGNTALHTAAFFCKAELVTLLLEKGADVNAKNSDGETALGSVSTPWAEAKGVYELLGGLLQLQLDLKAIETSRPKIAAQLRAAGGK